MDICLRSPVLPGAGSRSELPGAAWCVGGVGVRGTGLVAQQVVFGRLLIAGAVVGPTHSAVQLLAVGQQRSQAQQRREGYRWLSVLLLSSLSFLLILFFLHILITPRTFSLSSSSPPAETIIAREVRGSEGAGGGSRVWVESSSVQRQLHVLLWINRVFILEGRRESIYVKMKIKGHLILFDTKKSQIGGNVNVCEHGMFILSSDEKLSNANVYI